MWPEVPLLLLSLAYASSVMLEASLLAVLHPPRPQSHPLHPQASSLDSPSNTSPLGPLHLPSSPTWPPLFPLPSVPQPVSRCHSSVRFTRYLLLLSLGCLLHVCFRNLPLLRIHLADQFHWYRANRQW